MGFADAHNFGIVAAPPEDGLVVLLNQDTKSSDAWVDQIAACFGNDEKLGAMMPGLRTYDITGWDVNFLDCATENIELDEGPRKQHSEVLFELPVITAAAMVPRLLNEKRDEDSWQRDLSASLISKLT
ncbi:hypothetical protein OAK79_03340 [Akkermansiaceae bacterium]|nr:hypothetical protein [Akkermansiaceae bacterium]MDC0318780.1 hypothetical protein [Akkermansiaceae bacterium]